MGSFIHERPEIVINGKCLDAESAFYRDLCGLLHARHKDDISQEQGDHQVAMDHVPLRCTKRPEKKLYVYRYIIVRTFIFRINKTFIMIVMMIIIIEIIIELNEFIRFYIQQIYNNWTKV